MTDIHPTVSHPHRCCSCKSASCWSSVITPSRLSLPSLPLFSMFCDKR